MGRMTTSDDRQPANSVEGWTSPTPRSSSGPADRYRADRAAATLKPLPTELDSLANPPVGRTTAIMLVALGVFTLSMAIRGHLNPGFDPVALWVMTGCFALMTVLVWVFAAIALAMAHARVRVDAHGLSARSGPSRWSIGWDQIERMRVHGELREHPFNCRVTIVPRRGADLDQRHAWLITMPFSPRGSIGAPLASDEVARWLRRMAHAHGLQSPAPPGWLIRVPEVPNHLG